VKLYVEAKSKADLIRRLAAGEEISGYNYSMFGGGGIYMLDDNLADGTIIAIYSQMSQGNPVAKSWGTWTNKVLKSETFDAEMTVDEMNEMVKNLGPKAYFEFCYRFDIDSEDAQEMSWFIADHYDSPKIVSWLMENHDKFDAEGEYSCPHCSNRLSRLDLTETYTCPDCDGLIYEDFRDGYSDPADFMAESFEEEGFAAEGDSSGIQIMIPSEEVERITNHFGISQKQLEQIMKHAIKEELETTSGYANIPYKYNDNLSNILLPYSDEQIAEVRMKHLALARLSDADAKKQRAKSVGSGRKRAETGPNGRFYGGSRIEERKSIWQTAGVMGLTVIAAGAAYIWSHKKE